MKYILHTRFKSLSLSGYVNLPALTQAESHNGSIYVDGKEICYEGSQVALDHFSRNDDGSGMERGKLTKSIIKLLSKRDAKYQNRWDKIWNDPICQPLRQSAHADFWLWDVPFYQADIPVLKHIYTMIKDVK